MSHREQDDAPEWVFPVYLVTPVSHGTLPAWWHEAMARSVTASVDLLHAKPADSESIYLGWLTYAAGLWAARPLEPLYEPPPPGTAGERFASCYRSMFDLLRDRLLADQAALTAVGQRSYRPLVVLVLGVAPADTDNWRASRLRVLDGIGPDEAPDSLRTILLTVYAGEVIAATAAEMAGPSGVGGAYRVLDPGRTSEAISRLLVGAALRLPLLAAGKSEQLVLPHELPGLLSSDGTGTYTLAIAE
jgi:hypothetical protein